MGGCEEGGLEDIFSALAGGEDEGIGIGSGGDGGLALGAGQLPVLAFARWFGHFEVEGFRSLYVICESVLLDLVCDIRVVRKRGSR